MASPQKPRPQEEAELTWGWHCLETALQRGVGLLSTLRLSEVGGRVGGVWDTSSPARGSQGGRMRPHLSYGAIPGATGVCGSLPSPTPEWGMLGDWKHLNFLFY